MRDTDAWGNPVTVHDPSQTARLDDLVSAYVRMSPDVPVALKAALADEPPLLARCMHGYFQVLAGRPETFAEARRTADELAAEATADTELTDRERRFVAALDTWQRGHLDDTVALFGDVLADHPTDWVALRFGYFLTFTINTVDAMVAMLDEVDGAWDDGLRHNSFRWGMAGFAMEELGDHRPAEELARRALDTDPADLWSIHAVAHVLEMEQRATEGIHWLIPMTGVLHAGGSFSRHIWWHRALYHLAEGDTVGALDLYDDEVYPTAVGSTEALDITDAVSLLMRLELLGVDVGDRWSLLGDACAFRMGQHDRPFNDAQYVAGLVYAGRHAEADQLLAEMRAWMAGRDGSASRVLDTVGMAVAEGMVAFARGDCRKAAALMAPTQPDWWRIGGSHAQRDVFTQVLAAAQA